MRRYCFLLTVLALLAPHPLKANESGSASNARNAANEALVAARETTLALDIALRAVENATAARDETEKAFLIVLKGSKSRDEIRRAREAIRKKVEDLDDALAFAERIADYSTAANGAARDAGVAADRASKAKTRREARAAEKEAIALLKAAGKAARKTARITETVKNRWLLPSLSPVS